MAEASKRNRAVFAIDMLVATSLSVALVYLFVDWYVNANINAYAEASLNPLNCIILNFHYLTVGFLGVFALTVARIFINKKLTNCWKLAVLLALVPPIITLAYSYMVYFSYGYPRLPRGITLDGKTHVEFARNTPWLFALYFAVAGLCEMAGMMTLCHGNRQQFECRLVKLHLFYPFLWLLLSIAIWFVLVWLRDRHI